MQSYPDVSEASQHWHTSDRSCPPPIALIPASTCPSCRQGPIKCPSKLLPARGRVREFVRNIAVCDHDGWDGQSARTEKAAQVAQPFHGVYLGFTFWSGRVLRGPKLLCRPRGGWECVSKPVGGIGTFPPSACVTSQHERFHNFRVYGSRRVGWLAIQVRKILRRPRAVQFLAHGRHDSRETGFKYIGEVVRVLAPNIHHCWESAPGCNHERLARWLGMSHGSNSDRVRCVHSGQVGAPRGISPEYRLQAQSLRHLQPLLVIPADQRIFPVASDCNVQFLGQIDDPRVRGPTLLAAHLIPSETDHPPRHDLRKLRVHILHESPVRAAGEHIGQAAVAGSVPADDAVGAAVLECLHVTRAVNLDRNSHSSHSCEFRDFLQVGVRVYVICECHGIAPVDELRVAIRHPRCSLIVRQMQDDRVQLVHRSRIYGRSQKTNGQIVSGHVYEKPPEAEARIIDQLESIQVVHLGRRVKVRRLADRFQPAQETPR